jgi:hypothetical protein
MSHLHTKFHMFKSNCSLVAIKKDNKNKEEEERE